MKNIVVFSENNKFILELFKDKNFKKQFSIKCIIASVINLKNLKDSFKNEKIITIENFTKSNLEFIPKNKKNLMDVNNYKIFSKIESECIKMLDFSNPNQDKFTLIDARQLYTDSVEFILNFLEHFKPDIVFFTNSPHSFQSYILYKICEIKNIKTIFKREISLPLNYIFQNSILVNDDNFNFNSKKENSKVRIILKNYIKKIINNEKKNVQNIFLRLRNHKLIYRKKFFNNFYLFLIIRFLKLIPIYLIRYLKNLYIFYKFKNKDVLMVEDFIKDKNKSYKKSYTSKIKMDFELFLGDLRKFKLLNYYNHKVTETDFSEKFIYFPLHYQPEATTYPFGGNYVDQLKAINLISEYFENCKIYIKEHPDTFNISQLAWTRGDYTRSNNFYDQISNIKNVKLIDLKVNTFDLIDNAHAVATVSGAVGLESLIKGKHTLILGYPWYNKFSQAFQFKNHEYISSNLKTYMNKKISKSKTIKEINEIANNIFSINEVSNEIGINRIRNLIKMKL